MNVSILGCGWLGLPLAESLRDSGHALKGSTTTEEKIQLLKGKNVQPFLLTLNPTLQCSDCDDFWQSDVLVLNIPPGRKRDNVEEYHPKQIKAVIEKVKDSPISFVVFVSSTSVYPKQAGIVNEEDAVGGKATRPSGNALLKAEQLFTNIDDFKTTIIRFGGLYGYDRHPANYLAGKKNLDRGNAPVNLIHCDDCVAILKNIIEQNVTGETYNAVTDGHPPRKMYYKAAAEVLGLKKPTFKDDPRTTYKVVSNRKLKQELGYSFKYPNPMDLKA